MRSSHSLQVVDVVDEDALKLAHCGVHVARDSNINEKHRAILAALHEPLPMLLAKDRVRRSCRADDDVGINGRVVHLVVRDHSSLEGFGHALGARLRPVGDQDGSCALLHQMAGGEFAHLAGADKEHGPALQVTEDLLRQLHGD